MTEKEQQNQNFKHIVRIANVDVPGEKPIVVALTKIKGVGKNLAAVICSLANVDRQAKIGNLTNDQVQKLNDVTASPLSNNVPTWMANRQRDYETGENKHILTGTLNFTKENDLKRLKKIKSYRGLRHQKKLPVRGQRTRSNFRKSKGKVVGVKKKGKK